MIISGQYLPYGIWHHEESNIFECAKIAKQLFKKYPDQRIFSLGQSPAWIIKAISFIPEASKAITGYIPFSGKFYERSPFQDPSFFFLHHGLPVHERPIYEKNYRKVLSLLEVDPASIIQKAQNEQKTVIVEYSGNYGSLVSFLSVVYTWAAELNNIDQLQQALTICVLRVWEEHSLENLFFDVKKNGKLRIGIDTLYVKHKTIAALANGLDSGSLSDRLVPYYPASKWETLPILSEEHQTTLLHITNKLKIYAESPEDSLPPSPTSSLLNWDQAWRVSSSTDVEWSGNSLPLPNSSSNLLRWNQIKKVPSSASIVEAATADDSEEVSSRCMCTLV